MTEVLSEQNEQREPRPIGRFLLGLDDFVGREDPLEYATRFSQQPDNFRMYRHRSVNVPLANKELTIDGRGVTLEFAIGRSALVWTVTIAAERHRIEDFATAYIPHGGEQYQLHCANPKSFGTYREYGMQRRIQTQKSFETPAALNHLQGLVETLLNTESSNEDR